MARIQRLLRPIVFSHQRRLCFVDPEHSQMEIYSLQGSDRVVSFFSMVNRHQQDALDVQWQM